ncbi:MAG: hypothetical protein OXF02_01845 [Simkaniaceae bacterium]|nr:hypothetical protein [Simkaniaceae bacterium]
MRKRYRGRLSGYVRRELEAPERADRLATDLRARSERMRRIYATKSSVRRGNSVPWRRQARRGCVANLRVRPGDDR